MHTIRVNFGATKKKKSEHISELVNYLLGAWRMNGQILGNQFLIAQTKTGLEVYVDAPDADSLSEEFNNKYVNKRLAGISEQDIIAKITVLGKEPESASLCECKQIKSYILFTTYISLESPLKCTDCFGIVPLYKIPKTADEEYHNIISWQSNYQSCDSLQINCEVGEKFGTNQLSKYDSQLTKQGLKVCQSIEKATGRKVYYYLYKYSAKSYKSELSRKCPSCKSDWHLKEPLHNIFDFKCEKCNLLSNIACDVRP
jgi:predicted  nucleic acid-binding Zn ribbon protein